MMVIKSKRKISLLLLFLALSFFLGGFGALLLWMAIAEGTLLIGLVGLLMLFVVAEPTVSYFRSSRSVKIDEHKIVFGGRETCYWDNIDSIALNTTTTFKYSRFFVLFHRIASLIPGHYVHADLDQKQKAIMICFKDQKARFIFDDVYSNIWQVRLFLQQVIIDKQPYKESKETKVLVSEMAGEQFVFFSGPQLKCFFGGAMWVLSMSAGLFALANLIAGDSGTAIFLGILALLVFYGISLTLNYFGVSEKYFVVRKHNLPWKRKLYRLTDIKEVVFEDNGAIYEYLKIVTHNFKTYRYMPPTLAYKTWFPLKDELEKHGVKVVNTCINEYYKD